MRLIDADYIKNLPFERLIHTDFGDTAIPIEEIDNAPTIPLPDFKEGYKQAILDGQTNFKRPQGKWIELRDYDFKCSLCGFSIMDKYNFCPECGADMRGKDDQLRDCENCVHHSENGCEVWECEFKRRSS